MNLFSKIASWLRQAFSPNKVGEWGTAGPHLDLETDVPLVVYKEPAVGSLTDVTFIPSVPPPPPEVHSDHAPFVNGYWRLARAVKPHPGRMSGGAIDPEFVVEHTTDMHPDDWQALVNAWMKRASDGSCAHFLIGRTPEQGVLQFIPITHNGNHAGGGGSFVINGKLVHPNQKAVGIELHCGGRLRFKAGVWRWGENDGKGWVAKGRPIPDSDVEPLLPMQNVYGFHKPTAYQLHMIGLLETDLALTLRPLTDRAWTVQPKPPDAYPRWLPALRKGVPVLAHAHLNPTDREDPGPALCLRMSKIPWFTSRGSV